MRRGVSSHDVARKAGVSQTTVSLVLNGRMDARISEATRARVFAAARELGYSRNRAARALATGRTERIGFVPSGPHVFRYHDAYSLEVLSGVMEAASDLNHDVLLHSGRYPDWRALYGDIMGASTDGVLLVGRHSGDPLTAALLSAGFPLVCVSFCCDDGLCHGVDCDNESGGYLAAQHLLDLGHRHIALVELESATSWTQERYGGVARAVAEAKDRGADLHVLDICPLVRSGGDPVRECIAAIFSAVPRPTGVVFIDEWHARAVAEGLRDAGCRLPADLSIVSFNSSLLSIRAKPPLTSVWQPLVEIGKTAASLLVDLIHGRDVAPGVRRFPVQLEVRESTARPSNR